MTRSIKSSRIELSGAHAPLDEIGESTQGWATNAHKAGVRFGVAAEELGKAAG